MRLQRAPFHCGPLALLNAARALGVKLTEREIRAHTGTTKKEGTNQYGLLSALEKLGFDFREIKADKSEAFDILREVLKGGSAAVLCVEDSRHWVAAIGVIGSRIVTFDSWNSNSNRAECGVDVLDRRQLLRWWMPDVDGVRYCIAFKKEDTR